MTPPYAPDPARDPIRDTTQLIQRVELRYHIHHERRRGSERGRGRPFLMSKSSASAPAPASPPSWEELQELQEEKEQRQYTRAMVAGIIIVMAVWLWLLAVGVHWVGAQIWQAFGHSVWQHLLGGGLSL
jgi:hypothetical protein